MNREIYTFASDGTGTYISNLFGYHARGEITRNGMISNFGTSIQFTLNSTGDQGPPGTEVYFGTNFRGAPTLEEARNAAWEWVANESGQEPYTFNWKLTDDLVEISFIGFEYEITFNLVNSENGFALINEPDIIFYKEQ